MIVFFDQIRHIIMFTKVSKWKKGTHYLCKTCTKCLRISETILWLAAAFSLCRHTRPLSPATSGIAWRGGAVVFTTWIWLHPEPGPSQGGSHNCTSFRVLIFWTWTIRWTWLMRIITGSLQGLLRSILQCGEVYWYIFYDLHLSSWLKWFFSKLTCCW